MNSAIEKPSSRHMKKTREQLPMLLVEMDGVSASARKITCTARSALERFWSERGPRNSHVGDSWVFQTISPGSHHLVRCFVPAKILAPLNYVLPGNNRTVW